MRKITEYFSITHLSNKMFQRATKGIYCLIHAALPYQTALHKKWGGGSTCHICGNTS